MLQGIAAYPAGCEAAGGRSGACKEEVVLREGTSTRPPAAHAPSLTCEAYLVPALPAASGFQVPDIAAQASAELLSDAPLPLQKLLPDAADASPTSSENADMA